MKQVHDVSYDVGDYFQDSIMHIENAYWWFIPRLLLDRRYVAKQMKEVKANVEDDSLRNVLYCLMNNCSSKVDNTSNKPIVT